MKVLREIFVFEWKYKLTALIIAVTLWGVVNLGSRTPVEVMRKVELRGDRLDFIYRVEPERVEVTVYVVEKLLFSDLVDRVKVFVNVSRINREGTYELKVEMETPFPVFIQPASASPPTVKVYVRSAAAE